MSVNHDSVIPMNENLKFLIDASKVSEIIKAFDKARRINVKNTYAVTGLRERTNKLSITVVSNSIQLLYDSLHQLS